MSPVRWLIGGLCLALILPPSSTLQFAGAQEKPVRAEVKPVTEEKTVAEPPKAASPTATNASAPTADAHPLAPAIKLANVSREALLKVKDYSATFNKREFVGRSLVTQKSQIKLREQPFSVYLQFETPNKGREVLYVDGSNKNMLLAHDTGISALIGTVSLAPNSPTAMADNRYPITMIGMRNMLDQVIKQWEAETQFGEVEVQFFPNAKLGATECKVTESKHSTPRTQFKYHMTRLYIDKQTELPIRVEQFGFPKKGEKQPPILEEYTYTNLKLNQGLADLDFDTKNPNYAFR